MPKLKSKPAITMQDSSTGCKSMPCSTFMRLRGTDKVYQEALEAASRFNRRLFIDRKTRIPFIDSQTRVAQTNSLLWYLEYQREEGIKPEQVYSYPLKSWVKKRRLHYDIDASMLRHHQFDVQQLNENSNSTDSMQNHAHKYAVNEADEHTKPLTMEDWHVQEDSFDYYNNDNDNDNESDIDDYEEKRKKPKKGKGSGKRRSEIHPDDKPFVCDKCGVKYKTKPGLTYHIQKIHHNKSRNNSAHSHLTHASSHSNHSSPDVNIEVMNSQSRLSHKHDYNDENTNSTACDENSHHHEAKSLANTKLCSSCGFGSIDQDPKRQVDLLISCCECPRLFHPICLNFTANMISSVKKYKWQCIECKKCVICGNSENDDKLLFCDDCDRGYHMYCLTPALEDAPDGDWRCELCVKEFGSQ